MSVSRRASKIHVLRVRAPGVAAEMKLGESVAVSGACLTVVSSERDAFEAEMMEETIRSTRLGSLKPGDKVNLERALRLGDRLDGHLVSGHVDGTAAVKRVEDAGDTRKCWISLLPSLSGFIACKGSVAIDGVSLTVIDVQDGEFSVGLIPTTLRETTIGGLRPGDPVNIEVDLIARYIARLMGRDTGENIRASAGITWDKLRENGWI